MDNFSGKQAFKIAFFLTETQLKARINPICGRFRKTFIFSIRFPFVSYRWVSAGISVLHFVENFFTGCTSDWHPLSMILWQSLTSDDETVLHPSSSFLPWTSATGTFRQITACTAGGIRRLPTIILLSGHCVFRRRGTVFLYRMDSDCSDSE